MTTEEEFILNLALEKAASIVGEGMLKHPTKKDEYYLFYVDDLPNKCLKLLHSHSRFMNTSLNRDYVASHS